MATAQEMLEGALPTLQTTNSGRADPNTWPECSVLALERCLESGDLDLVEGMLGGRRTAMVLELRSSLFTARIQAIEDRLAEARTREAAGGRGSLIDPTHPVIIMRRQRDEIVAARGAGRSPRYWLPR